MKTVISISIGMLWLSLASGSLALDGEETMVAASKRVISPSKAVFRGLSRTMPIKTSVDGPLLGNGDMAVCLSEIMVRKEGGKAHQVANGPRFWLSKNDFWRLAHDYNIGPSGPRVFGGIDVKFPNLSDGSETEQNLYDAVTVSRWAGDKSGAGVGVRSWVAASENMLVVELTASGRDVVIDTEVACAMKMLGATAPGFKLKVGRPVTILVAMQSRFKTPNPLENVLERIDSMDQAALAGLRKKHAAWWQAVWARSFVEIGDPVLEQRYYLSNYVIASASRDPGFPPALFGPWITTDAPGWMGDYHLNYNYMAPFYGLYSSNHIEQADPYHTPLMDFRPRAQWYAKNAYNVRGVIYPIGIGPKDIETTLGYPDTGYARPVDFAKGGLFYSQKSNAAYALVNVVMRWYLTYDKDYARQLYPLVRDVADFWEDYLKLEDGRYVIENDSIHERSQPGDFNSIVSLGLVRSALELAIDMSSELEIDADRHPKWQHILDHLSGWSYQELSLPRARDEDPGVVEPRVKVFRYTERGTAWWRNNTLAIQHSYPAGAIGLDSPPEEIEVARNTLNARNGWFDGNGKTETISGARLAIHTQAGENLQIVQQ